MNSPIYYLTPYFHFYRYYKIDEFNLNNSALRFFHYCFYKAYLCVISVKKKKKSNLILFIFIQWSHAVPAANTQEQTVKENNGMNTVKEKVVGIYNTAKQSTLEKWEKVEPQTTNFFSNALSKLKNAFNWGKTTNADDKTKQEAIKAFDEYAEKHPK